MVSKYSSLPKIMLVILPFIPLADPLAGFTVRETELFSRVHATADWTILIMEDAWGVSPEGLIAETPEVLDIAQIAVYNSTPKTSSSRRHFHAFPRHLSGRERQNLCG